MDLEFKDITLSSKNTINKYIKPWNCMNAEFSFPHIYIWGSNSKIQYAIKDDCLFLKLDFDTEKPFLWPPFPLNETVDYKKAIETALEYTSEAGINTTLRSVCSPFKEMIENIYPGIEFVPTRNNFDYVYLSEKMIGLKGKKLHGKRNHINKFLKTYPNFVYEELTKDHYEECMEIYDSWSQEHKEFASTQSDERDSVERALLNLDDLGLNGGCIRMDGIIRAFTIGEQVLPNMSQIHIEKASKDIDGLYPMINQLYATAHCENTMYINREEDMGLEGLRKAKSSYYPEMLFEKYDVAVLSKAKVSQVEKETCSTYSK